MPMMPTYWINDKKFFKIKMVLCQVVCYHLIPGWISVNLP